MTTRFARAALIAALAAATVAAGRSTAPPRPPAAVRLDPPIAPGDRLAPDEKAVVRPDATLALEVRVPKGGATDAWLKKYAADPAAFRRARGRPLPGPGETLRLPLAGLTDDMRVAVLRALFPGSAPRGAEWVHPMGGGRLPPAQQSMERIATWYTGSARNAAALEARNDVGPQGPRAGQEIVIPRALLLPGFARRTMAPAATTATAANTAAATPGPAATLGPAATPGTAATPGPTATSTVPAAVPEREPAPPLLPPLPDRLPEAARATDASSPAASAATSSTADAVTGGTAGGGAPAAGTAPASGGDSGVPPPATGVASGPPAPSTPGAQAVAAAPPTPGADAPAATEPAATAQEDDFTEAPTTPGDEEDEGPSIGAPAPYAPPPAAEGAGDLKYGRDRDGGFAVYRLKKGEALYSAVVIRFTGRVDVQEVNDLAAKVARRSGIDNVTGIRVGYPVKIPIDDLLPEYLPRDDPRRQAWERSHAAVERYTNAAGSRNLDGVAVILDAGHGGRDIGASHNGIWEHDYVYDVLCRVKKLLEATTRARVMPTIKDRRDGYTIRDATRLPRSRSEVLLTSPPFPLTGTVPSVNLRWYLSNAWFRRLTGEGVDPDKIVFTSLHADARHPSLRGAMVYVPGAEYRRGRYGSAGAVYARYREARETPFVSFTREQRERSEGLSRQFAAALMDAFAGRQVAVHPYGPVRERIIRRGRSWVPAVLRCNIVPVQVLVEISNLSNPEDSRSLADPAYRQRVAEAYVEGLVRYFSAPSTNRPAVAAGAGSRSR